MMTMKMGGFASLQQQNLANNQGLRPLPESKMNLIRAKLKNIFKSLPRNAVGFHTTTLTLGKKPQLFATFVCFDKKTGLTFFVDRCCTKAQTEALYENELIGSVGFSLK